MQKEENSHTHIKRIVREKKAGKKADANTTSSTCTISNLEANEIYNIKVKLETDKGTVERTVNVQVGEMPVGKVNFGDYAWQGDGIASIVINTTETGYTLQYQVVGAESEIQENNWTEINSGENNNRASIWRYSIWKIVGWNK